MAMATANPSLALPSAAARKLLDALRGDPTRRRAVDPGLAGGLREWLEDGLSSVVPLVNSPLVVTKRVIREIELSGHLPRSGPAPVNTALAIGCLMDALFRQLVTLGHIADPMEDGLAALRIGRRRSEVVAFIAAMGQEELGELRDEVETQSAILLSRWPRLSPRWLPRTQERLTIPLAGGGVTMVGVVDLVVGAPSGGRSSVALFETKSGHAKREDREDLSFYALLETLRSGAPPSRVATFYTRTGHVDAEDVDEDRLIATVQRVLSTIGQLKERRP